jgi:hypothetical protein
MDKRVETPRWPLWAIVIIAPLIFAAVIFAASGSGKVKFSLW